MKDNDLMWFYIEEKTTEKFKYVYIFVLINGYPLFSNKSTIYWALISCFKAN